VNEQGLKKWMWIVGGLVVATALFMARRPDEFFAPYVWDEEAGIITHLMDHGWITAITPVNGQLILYPSTLLSLSASGSWSMLPTLNYVLAVLTFTLTGVLLLVPNSRWGSTPMRCLALALWAVLPINAETYGVLLYSFWWTSLWPVIALGWKHPRPGLRLVVLVVAGLSSIGAASMFVVYAMAAARARSRALLVCAGVLLVCWGVQVVVYLRSVRAGLGHRIGDTLAQSVINAYEFVLGPLTRDQSVSNPVRVVVGALLVTLIGSLIMGMKDRDSRFDLSCLLVAAGIFSLVSSVPAPLITNPITAGPRYYFLPFAALGLLLLALIGARRQRRAMQVGAAFLLVMALVGVPETLVRHSDRMSWRNETETCARSNSDPYPFPMQLDGVQRHAFEVPIDPSICRVALTKKGT
jgi:hypothetical protein